MCLIFYGWKYAEGLQRRARTGERIDLKPVPRQVMVFGGERSHVLWRGGQRLDRFLDSDKKVR